MAHGTIEFFGPTSPISVPSGWTFQDGGAISSNKTRAAELGSDGDESASALHDPKSTTAFIYRSTATSGNYAFPKPGTVTGGWHIDSFRVVWDRQQKDAKMTVNCHRHDAGTAHAANSCRTYTPSLDGKIAVVAFGCPVDFDDAFALDDEAVVDLRSAEYSCSCQHIDELDHSGNELAGENHDGAETLHVELTGAATSDDYASEWDEVSKGVTPSNSAATSTSFDFEHHIAHDTGSSN